MREMGGVIHTVTIAETGTVSEPFGRPPTGFLCAVLFPVMDAGGVGIQISPDAGVTWHVVDNPLDGSPLVITTAGANPRAIDITDKILAFIGVGISFRFTCAAQGSERTVSLIFAS